MTTPTPTTTASRFSPTAFHRYADAIALILSKWPDLVTFDPKPFSVETFAARLRDAVTAALRYRYVDPKVDLVQLSNVASTIVVAIRGDRVVVGPREAMKLVKQAPTNVGDVSIVGGLIITVAGDRADVIRALALLLSERVLQATVKIVKPPPGELTQYLTGLDVALSYDAATDVLTIV